MAGDLREFLLQEIARLLREETTLLSAGSFKVAHLILDIPKIKELLELQDVDAFLGKVIDEI